MKDPGNEVVFLRGGPLLSPFKRRIPINLLQWTYCLAASSVIGSSVWFYVQTISHRNAAYCAAVLLGFGGSVMYVTSTALAGELIGESKDSGAYRWEVWAKLLVEELFSSLRSSFQLKGKKVVCG